VLGGVQYSFSTQSGGSGQGTVLGGFSVPEFFTDPDPSLHFDARIMLRIKVMRICNLRSKYSTPRLHFEPPPRFHYEPLRLQLGVYGPLWLHFEPLKLLNSKINADPDPAFHSSAAESIFPK
jgi:hypothetical protein